MADLLEEAQRREEMRRGDRAAEIINDPIYQEAFAVLRDQLRQQWEESPARDTEGREKLWLMSRLLNAVDANLKTVMQTGKLSSLQMDQRKTLAQRAKDWTGIDW